MFGLYSCFFCFSEFTLCACGSWQGPCVMMFYESHLWPAIFVTNDRAPYGWPLPILFCSALSGWNVHRSARSLICIAVITLLQSRIFVLNTFLYVWRDIFVAWFHDHLLLSCTWRTLLLAASGHSRRHCSPDIVNLVSGIYFCCNCISGDTRRASPNGSVKIWITLLGHLRIRLPHNTAFSADRYSSFFFSKFNRVQVNHIQHYRLFLLDFSVSLFPCQLPMHPTKIYLVHKLSSSFYLIPHLLTPLISHDPWSKCLPRVFIATLTDHPSICVVTGFLESSGRQLQVYYFSP